MNKDVTHLTVTFGRGRLYTKISGKRVVFYFFLRFFVSEFINVYVTVRRPLSVNVMPQENETV